MSAAQPTRPTPLGYSPISLLTPLRPSLRLSSEGSPSPSFTLGRFQGYPAQALLPPDSASTFHYPAASARSMGLLDAFDPLAAPIAPSAVVHRASTAAWKPGGLVQDPATIDWRSDAEGRQSQEWGVGASLPSIRGPGSATRSYWNDQRYTSLPAFLSCVHLMLKLGSLDRSFEHTRTLPLNDSLDSVFLPCHSDMQTTGSPETGAVIATDFGSAAAEGLEWWRREPENEEGHLWRVLQLEDPTMMGYLKPLGYPHGLA